MVKEQEKKWELYLENREGSLKSTFCCGVAPITVTLFGDANICMFWEERKKEENEMEFLEAVIK